MERGANTFPFHNLLPYSESNEGLFLYFLPSLNWIKIKAGGDSCYPHICDTKTYKVSSPCYRTGDSAGERDTLKRECLKDFLDHLYCFLFDLLALLLRVAWVLYLWGILHPDPGFLL